jgi:hypothetical protein
MVQDALSFLTDEDVVLPTGGTGGSQGFVAPWQAQIFYNIMSTTGPEALDGIQVVKDRLMGESGWHRYYFVDFASSQKAVAALGVRNANELWVFETPTTRVINAGDM